MRRVIAGIIIASLVVLPLLFWHGLEPTEELGLPAFSEVPEFDELDIAVLAEAAPTSELRLVYLARMQDWEALEGALAEFRSREGWTPTARRVAARMSEVRGELGRARRHVAAGLRLDPADARAHLLAVDLALAAEEPAEALAHLGELDPSLTAVRFRRAWAHEMDGRLDAAEADYAAVAAREPTSLPAVLGLARLARVRGDLELARARFAEGAALAEDDARALTGLGLTLLDMGSTEEAAEALEAAIAIDRQAATAWIGLGDAEFRRDRHEAALADYREGYRLEPSGRAAVKLGNQLARLNQLAEAETSYRAALTHEPDVLTRGAALNGLGAVLMHTDRGDLAAAAFARAASLDPRDPHPLMNLALLHERAGRLEEAREAWARALERDPDSAIARARVGS